MILPKSFTDKGFAPLAPSKRRRLLIGLDGWPNSGKTEFSWSAPEPIIHIILDRNYEECLHNPRPPKTRAKEIYTKTISAPLATQATTAQYVEYWKSFYHDYMDALSLPEARTVVIDGDSDSWELQKLAEFGRITNIPPLALTQVNAARRAMYARAFDSGKIVIFTNKLKEGYETKINKKGDEVQVKTGEEERQGFRDQTYLFGLQLRCLINREDATWGVRIMMCKADTAIEGQELWGEDCSLASVLQTIYPYTPLKDWGYR